MVNSELLKKIVDENKKKDCQRNPESNDGYIMQS